MAIEIRELKQGATVGEASQPAPAPSGAGPRADQGERDRLLEDCLDQVARVLREATER